MLNYSRVWKWQGTPRSYGNEPECALRSNPLARKVTAYKSGSHHTWTDAELAQFEAKAALVPSSVTLCGDVERRFLLGSRCVCWNETGCLTLGSRLGNAAQTGDTRVGPVGCNLSLISTVISTS
jgi:hypothetical protein